MSTPGQPAQAGGRRALAVVAEKAGHTLIELAVAFVINHPGVTFRHHRTAHHGPAGGVPAGCGHHPVSDVLDAIDDIVAPGVTVNPVDNSYGDF